MKYFFFSFLLFYAAFAEAQRFESVISNNVYELNGGARAALGGRSRLVVPIQIPQGASGIIYAVTAVKANNGAGQFNLCLALTTAAVTFSTTGNFMLTSLAGRVKLPEGNTVADIFLLAGRSDVQFFEQKEDNDWQYYIDYSQVGCSSCAIAVPVDYQHPSRLLYLGIRNPSMIDGIKFTVNVSAVFED